MYVLIAHRQLNNSLCLSLSLCGAVEVMAMACWIQALVFLLLSLLLARKLCGDIAGWLAYLWISLPLLKRPQTNGTTMLKSYKLQVILCGFSRSGTMSLMQALNMLGFPCFHGWHLAKPTTAKLFIKAYTSGNNKYWEKLLDGYGSIASFPAASAYKELMGIFPNAKIILNIRDPSRWYDSFFQTILQACNGHAYPIFKVVTPCVLKCLNISFFNKFRANNKETWVKVYCQHIDEVKAQVASSNLLVYDIDKEDGWPKLCEFLNVPIPSLPFPKTNDRKQLNLTFQRMERVFTLIFSLYIALVACILFYLLSSHKTR